MIDRYRNEVLLPDLAAKGQIYTALEAIKARVRAGRRTFTGVLVRPLPCHADHLKAYIMGDEHNPIKESTCSISRLDPEVLAKLRAEREAEETAREAVKQLHGIR